MIHRTALRTTLCLVATLLASGPAGTLAAQQIEIPFRLTEGVTYRQLMVQDNQVSAEVMGQSQDTHTQTTTTSSYHVLESSSAGMLVEITNDAMAISVDNPMMSVRWDSEEGGNVPEMARGMAAMVGESFRIRFDGEGSVTDASGLQELSQKLLDELTFEGPAGAALRESLEDQFGADAFRDAMKNMTGHLPPGPISVGDSWTTSVDVPMGPAFSIDATWTLTDVTDGLATISGSSVIGDGRESVQEMGPMTLRYVLTGSQTSTFVVDVETGWTRTAEMDMDFSGTMSTDTPGGAITAPISMRIVTTIETLGGGAP